MNEDWFGWPVERFLLLFTALAAIMMSIQVTLFHYRGNFRHWAMWGPVLSLPLIGLLGLYLVFRNSSVVRMVLMFMLFAETAAGLMGFYYHSRAVNQRVGGFGMNNVLTGPPIVLPTMVTAISILGLLALFIV